RLVVGAADDRYEREADEVAAAVVQRLSMPAAAPVATLVAEPAIQRLASPGSAAGGPIDATTEERISSALGGGRPLEVPLRRSMEGAFRAKFGDVRVHDGAEAAALNEQLGATAFTLGNDVFFRDRVPSGDTPQSQHLLAHELTHVVQQRHGGAGVAQRVQRSIATFGGSFDTIQYEATSGKAEGGKQPVGGVIDLAFTPNELVDGKVGLVQTGNAKRVGKTDIGAGDAGKNARAQKADGLDEGRFLDRSNRKENPVFGLENQSAELSPMADASGISMTTDASGKAAEQRNRDVREGASALKEDPSKAVDAAKVSTQAGQVGFNDKAKGAVQAATLRDEPGRHRVWDPTTSTGEEISMTFETAALGLTGAIEGAYLGSVEWGFIAPADSATARPLPFRMISRGVPSEAFMLSAKLWNDNASMDMGGGTKRLNMPLALTTHRTDPAIDALLGNPDTPAATLRTALTARVALLRSQIPADIETRIEALRAVAIDDREAADEYQVALDGLQAQWRDFKAQVGLSAGNKAQKERDLATAQAALVAVNNSLNFLTRRIGDGKARVTAAKAEVASKQAALDLEKNAYNAAFDGQNALGPKINAAKTDADFRASLTKYRDSLMAVQNVMSDARSRQLEIDALLRELAKLPAEGVS
ncbi:MAG: DUF4157 domain-containing protein, partial [Ilumatobacteraceae bacterium]